MGVRLLHRTARSVVPTPVGERLAARLEQSFEGIEAALGDVESYRRNPAGELRLNLPRDAVRLVVGPVLAPFAAACPQVRVLLMVEDRPIDIVAEGYDAGVRYGGAVPEDMVAMPLTAPLRWVVVGAPSYLARHGRPEHPDDLTRHDCIRLHIGNGSVFRWELGDSEAMVRLDVQGPLGVNDTEAAVEAATDGLGLAYILERRALQEVERCALEIVMPDWASTGPGFCAYYASRKQTQPGLRQLIDMVRRGENLV